MMGARTTQGRGWGGIPPWLAGGLLSVLPLLILYIGFEGEFSQWRDRQREQAARNASSYFQQFDYAILSVFLQGTLSRVADLADRSPVDPLPLRTELQRLRVRWPGRFEAVVFDRGSRLVPDASDLPEFHAALASFGRDVAAYRRGDTEGLTTRFGDYRRFLGPFFPLRPKSFLNQGSWPAAFGSRRAFLLFDTPKSPRPWFMAWFTPPREAEGLAVREQVNRSKRPSPAFLSEVVDLQEPLSTQGGALPHGGDDLGKVLMELGDQGGPPVPWNGWLWSQLSITPHIRLLACEPDQGAVDFRVAHSRLVAGLGACLLLAIGGIQFWASRGGSLTIRSALLLLFCYSTAVPLGLLGLSAQGLLKERHGRREKEAFRRQAALLREMTRSSLDQLTAVEETLRRALRNPLGTGPEAVSRVIPRLACLARQLQPYIGVLFDPRGNAAFKWIGGYDATVERLLPIFGAQSRRRMEQINRSEPGLKDSAREQAMLATAESVGLDLEMLTSQLEANWGHLVEYRLGGASVLLTNLPVPDLAGTVQGVVLFLWGQECFRRWFPALRKTFQALVPETRLGLFTDNPPHPYRFYPPDFPGPPQLNELRTFLGQSTPVHRVVPFDGRNHLITGLRPVELQEREVYAIEEDLPIRQEVRRLALQIGLAGVLLMAMGLAIGHFLSRRFLTPLAHFSAGLSAVQKRDFRYRLPVTSDDELGRLAEAFNGVLEGMADLDVGRLVQEAFFPDRALSANGWEVFGTCRTASRVGGDAFDYFALPDGRWLLFIGDVTGHGVAPALVVAMAKAFVTHPGSPGRPAEILALMNEMILGLHSRILRMTCCLVVFDPRTGLLQASNAGHPFPLVVRAGQATDLRVTHPMLGYRVRQPFPEGQETLGADDWICLYTDGIIEAEGQDGAQIGPAPFRTHLPGLRGPTATATESAIRAWHAAACPSPAGAPTLADDATLIILQRSGSS